MESDNEEDWTIPIPQQLKDYLINISSKLHQLQKSSAIIESTVLAAPSKAEIIPFLDYKIDIQAAQKIESDASSYMQQIRDQQAQLKLQFNDQLSSLNEDLQIIYKYNRYIADFRSEYEQFRREVQQLRRQTDEIELKSQGNLAEYRKEQDLISYTFKYLTSDVNGMTGGVGQLSVLQSALDERLKNIRTDLLAKYTSILDQTSSSKLLLEQLLHNVPDTLQEARSQIEADMRQILTQERQRRSVEQNYFKGVMTDIYERLSGVKAGQNTLKADFEAAGQELLKHCDAQLQALRESLTEQLQKLISHASATREKVDDAVKEQTAQIATLKYFEQTFRQANQQWKASVAEVSANTSKYVSQLEQRIQEGVNAIRQMLIQATTASREATEHSDEIRAVWYGDWRKREQNVDEQLVQLSRLAEDVRNAVEGETNVRIVEVDEMSRRIQEVVQKLDKEIARKANKADVEKALWLKVDKHYEMLGLE